MIIRTFIAAAVPAGTITFLSNTGRDLAALLPPHCVKWTRPEQIHLTLFFLGDTPTEKLPAVTTGLDGVAGRFAPFNLQLDKLGCFPNPRRPRVIWVGLQGAVDRAKTLQKEIEAILLPLGWSAESKPFTPHLTLGRVREGQGTIELPWGQLLESRPVPVTAIHLVQSELRPAGPLYTIRHTSQLRG